MSEIKVEFEEIEAAIAEMKARSQAGSKLKVRVEGTKLIIRCFDRDDNQMEAVLYNDSTIGPELKLTHRLMFLKDKQRKEL